MRAPTLTWHTGPPCDYLVTPQPDSAGNAPQARGIRPPCDAPIASQPDAPEETGPRPNYPPPREPILTRWHLRQPKPPIPLIRPPLCERILTNPHPQTPGQTKSSRPTPDFVKNHSHNGTHRHHFQRIWHPHRPPCEPLLTQRPARFAHLARLRELARPDLTPRNPSHHPDTRYCALTADGSSRRTRPAHPGPVAPPRPAPVCRQTLPPAPRHARAGPPLAPPKPTKHPKSARRTAH